MFFNDDGTGYGTLVNRDGRRVYSGRHIPTARRWFGRKWPAVVFHGGRLFVDTGRFDGEFRVFEEAPQVGSFA